MRVYECQTRRQRQQSLSASEPLSWLLKEGGDKSCSVPEKPLVAKSKESWVWGFFLICLTLHPLPREWRRRVRSHGSHPDLKDIKSGPLPNAYLIKQSAPCLGNSGECLHHPSEVGQLSPSALSPTCCEKPD